MANTRGIKFVTFLVLALSFSLFVAEGHRGLPTPPTCTCQNNNNNNDNNNNDVSKNNDPASSTTNKNNNNAATTTNNSNNNNNNNNAATATNKNNNNASTTTKNNKDATTTKNNKDATTTTTNSHSSSSHDSSSHSSSSHDSSSHNSNNHSSSTTTNGNTSSNSTTSSGSNTTNNNTINNSSNNNNKNNNNSSSRNSSSSSSNNNNNNNNNKDRTTTSTTTNNNNNGVYDVTTFGAQGNGKAVYKNGDSMNGIALIQAWQKACYTAAVSSKVVIPKGTFAVATVVFAGPCKTNNITIELQGNLVADSDVSQFPNHEFIVFQNVNGVTFTGQGTLDVSTQVNKSCDPTKNDADIFNQFSSIKLYRASNVVVEGVTSLNPSSRHVLVVESQKVTIRNVKFNEKSVASNTKSNGIYISASSQVSVSNSIINTGEECVTISPGCNSISITGLTCAGGKGISIGLLAFLENVLDVKGVLIKNCLFKGTAFGVSINPRLEAKLSLITDINVEDLVMDGVQNPIIIKQQDDRFMLAQLIHARIMNVHFKNINGSVTTKNALSFSCSLVSPCEGITVDDVDLNFTGSVALQGNGGLDIIGRTIDHLKGLESLVNCLHAKVVFGGKHKGLSCGLLQ